MKAVLLAAGKGERLGQVTRTVPKPMVPIRGKPPVRCACLCIVMQPEFASLVAALRRFAGSIRWLHVPAGVGIPAVPGGIH